MFLLVSRSDTHPVERAIQAFRHLVSIMIGGSRRWLIQKLARDFTNSTNPLVHRENNDLNWLMPRE